MQIGSYRIERQLGHGGFGVVYIGVDVRLGRRAAIKQLLPALSGNREIVERFFNEAKAAANINHPGIVEIYDVGWHTDGSAYFAMKLLDGDSLSKRLHSGPMPLALAATIGRQVASALVAAHARGIVHRDLKPDNIILVPDDEVAIGERAVVLDFGIAKLGGTQGISQTRSGMMMGTPGYMSPEQCRGAGEVDHRTDLYALGCILFEMLTGRMPFVGEGPGEVMGMHQFVEPPTVRSLRPDMPPELDALVAKLLAKKLDQRLQQMSEVQTALQAFATGGRSKEHPVAAPIPSPASGTAPTVISKHEQSAPRDLISAAAQKANVPPQPSTFASARGEVVPELKKSSKKGLAIGVGAVTAIGIAIAVAVGAGGGDKPAPVVAAADVAVPPADAVAIADVAVVEDVAVAVASTSTTATDSLVAECGDQQRQQRWAALTDCGSKLEKIDPATGKKYVATAVSEAKAEVAFREMTDARAKKDLEALYTAYNKIPPDSSYRANARGMFDQAGDEFMTRVSKETKALADAASCKQIDVRLKTLRERAMKRAGTPHHYDRAIKVALKYPCTSVAGTTGGTGTALAKLPAGFQCGPGVPDKASGGCKCPAGFASKRDSQDFATCVDRRISAADTLDPFARDRATTTNICNDAAKVAEAEAEAERLQSMGSFAAALATLEKIVKCKPAVALKAYLNACKARNFPKAKVYFQLSGAKESHAQICMQFGFDPRVP